MFLALPYLHTANVNGQHGSEEKHLQKEVRHQADHSEEAELLQRGHTDELWQLRRQRYLNFRKGEIQQTLAQSTGLSPFY